MLVVCVSVCVCCICGCVGVSCIHVCLVYVFVCMYVCCVCVLYVGVNYVHVALMDGCAWMRTCRHVCIQLTNYHCNYFEQLQITITITELYNNYVPYGSTKCFEVLNFSIFFHSTCADVLKYRIAECLPKLDIE